MKYKRWLTATWSQQVYDSLRKEDVPPLVAAVLCSRGLQSREEGMSFLSWHPKLLCDPFLMKDMDKGVARIRQAIARGEKISIYGDYDVDGITSTCLLTHYLRGLGGTVCYYIPCRMDEGYGVNREAIDTLHREGVSLIITVDCGITAVEETEYARSLGIDLVITDHHECKDELPQAAAVINPHRKDCGYPFKELAGVGVAMKLAMAMGGEDMRRDILERYADLVAVGTIADVMVLLGENRTLVHIGLEQLKQMNRPGLSSLMAEAGTAAKTINSTTVGYCLAPRINAAGRMGKAVMAAELILTEREDEALRLSQELCELNRDRQAVELEIFNECVARLDKEPRHDSIVLADARWHQGVVGIVASRLSDRYACPVFMICLQDGKGKGSCRSYGGFTLFRALERCADLLEGYGGHALAAGFTILEENIPAFRERIDLLVHEDTGGEEMISTLAIDVDVEDVFELTVENVDTLSLLEPYGNGNPKPIFSLRNMTITCMSDVGGGRHLKLRAARDGRTLDAIFFSATGAQTGLQPGQTADLAFSAQINEYRGNRNVQLHLVDIRPAEQAAQGAPPAQRRAAGAPQSEAMLYESFLRGQRLPRQAAHRILPQREEFVALWRYLRSCGGSAEDTLERLAEKVSAREGLPNSPTKLMVCLDVFAECGLVLLERRENDLKVRSRTRAGGKLDLEQTGLMRRLRRMAEGE